MKYFKDLNFIAYDETHHISGERLYEYIKDNKPKHLLGVSATPMTRDTTQNDHIREIFGGTMPILSTCTYERAQKEGWINKCIFNTYLYTGNFEKHIVSTIDKIKKTIERRIEKDIWRCKRIIYYVPSSLENLGKVKEV